jgi:AraC-like DNA-binding protein
MPYLQTRKKEGFAGQKAIVIPRKILKARCEKNNISTALYITDIGYYPKAAFHYRERLHGAEQFILIYCIEGKGWVKIKNLEYAVNAGEFFIVPIYESHKYAADESDPWTIYWIHFKGVSAGIIADSLQKKLGSNKGFVHFTEDRVNIFNDIYGQLERGYGNDNIMYANMCLWYFLATFLFDDRYKASEKYSAQNIINNAIDFMGKKIDQIVTLEEIATFVNLSSSHFSTIFKKKTGFSPIEYFNHLKIQKASQYLLFSDLRIKEIASKLGIEDPYYFSRLFTKIMSLSPNEYRNKKNH